jgi:hypothetical protein
MDIARTADGRGVAEAFRHKLDRGVHGALGRRSLGRVELAQRSPCEDRRRPGPEVLGRVRLAGDLAQIRVDVIGADLPDLAFVVHVGEQLLSGQVLEPCDDARQPAIADRRLADLATLAAEPEPDEAALDRGVAAPQRRQAE